MAVIVSPYNPNNFIDSVTGKSIGGVTASTGGTLQQAQNEYNRVNQGGNAYLGGQNNDTNQALNQMKSALDVQTQAQTALYNQQAAAQAEAIRQAIARQAQQGEATKTDYTNQMNTAIGTLNTERAKIPGQTTTLNNAASSQGMQNAQHIRNALAQMGLLQSGESATQQLANNTSVANNVNTNNLQGQQLDTGYGNQISSAQTDLASKVKAINDAIALAQSQGDTNSMLALQDAQSKIASTAAQNATTYQNWAYQTGKDATANQFAQQQAQAKAIQDAIDNAYKQAQADQAARQWQDTFDTNNSQWDKTFNADQAYKAAVLAKPSGSSNGSSGITSTNPFAPIAKANSSTQSMAQQIIQALGSGATVQQMFNDLETMDKNGSASAREIDTNVLRSIIGSIPIDNWQRILG